ncbi:MAG: tRNA (N(6)-L-threonylcarbamoyladenosine(37)-C(2))-methylthiotransferase MtaB, partial [Bacteroidetes bacterium]|nr:tRNA (N(6)-L-threonylcarbamoyladenosine(37)-C(2))-methylthiotransferase MtaB [Bacteroidota bacterium]
ITRDFLENADISYIHVFSYSLRKNTKSAHFPDRVPHTEIARRSKILHELSERKHRCFCKKHIGEEAEVLFEKKGRNGKIYGFTGNYIRVETKYDPELANRITRVILGEISDNGTMKGRVLKKKYKYEPEVLM